MGTLRDLVIALRGTLAEWLRLRWTDLQFTEAGTAFFMVVVVLALSLLLLTSRRLWSGRAGRTKLTLPAILPLMTGSYWSAAMSGRAFTSAENRVMLATGDVSTRRPSTTISMQSPV